MELVLEILGGALLIVLVVVVGGFFYLRAKLRKLAAYGDDDNMTPLYIHLNEDPAPDWVDKQQARALESELSDLKFTAGKTYTVFEMNGFKIKSFSNPPFLAVMYDHPMAGNWVDIVARTTEGQDLTVSNAIMGGEVALNPEAEKKFLRDHTPAQLLDAMHQMIGDRECVDLTQDDFRDHFEQEYKKEMKWKIRNGGMTREDINNVAVSSGENYDNDIMEEAYFNMKSKELRQWHDAAMEEFGSDKKENEEACENMFYEHVVVPPKTDPVAYVRYLGDMDYISEEQIEKYESAYKDEEDIPALFSKINESYSPELRAENVGQVTYPADMAIYKMKRQPTYR